MLVEIITIKIESAGPSRFSIVGGRRVINLRRRGEAAQMTRMNAGHVYNKSGPRTNLARNAAVEVVAPQIVGWMTQGSDIGAQHRLDMRKMRPDLYALC